MRRPGLYRWISLEIPFLEGARWGIPFLIALLLAALEADRLLHQGAALGRTAGALDPMFALLNHKIWRFMVLTPLWLLVSHPSWAVQPFDTWIVLRLGSRLRWWALRVGSLMVMLGLYLGLLALGALLPGAALFPISASWSDLARARPDALGLSAAAVALPPGLSLGMLFGLLTLGWLAVGLLALAAALSAARPIVGYLAGLGLTLLGLIAWHMDWALPNFEGWPHRRWFLDLPPMEEPWRWLRHIALSQGYWFAWVGAALAWSAWAAARWEFVGEERPWAEGGRLGDLGRRLRWHLASFWGWWIGPGLGLFAGISGVLAYEIAARAASSGARASVVDVLWLALGGPPVGRMEWRAFLFWAAPQMWFLFGTGDLSVGDLFRQHGIILFRIGGRRRWWFEKALAFSIAAWGYSLAGFLSAGLVAAWFGSFPGINWSLWLRQENLAPPIAGWWTLILMFLLWGSNLTALGLGQQVLAVRLRHTALAFGANLLLLLSAWVIGSICPGSIRWLPGVQGIPRWHAPFASSFDLSPFWSLSYNVVWALGMLGVGWVLMSRIDIIGVEQSR